MTRPHLAQLSQLSFLALAPAERFVDRAEIDQARRVRPNGDLFVFSLIARNWAEMEPAHRPSVRITDVRRNVLTGTDPADWSRRPKRGRKTPTGHEGSRATDTTTYTEDRRLA